MSGMKVAEALGCHFDSPALDARGAGGMSPLPVPPSAFVPVRGIG